jgi:FtsP/CotA-like multicopper oxidase with cupredoxin domain
LRSAIPASRSAEDRPCGAVNGTLPAPLIRLREGQDLTIHVTNHLDEDTSIHWHGLLLPFEMDGVPGVSFPGIKPRTTFTYASRSGRPVPTGTTAIPGCRSRKASTGR